LKALLVCYTPFLAEKNDIFPPLSGYPQRGDFKKNILNNAFILSLIVSLYYIGRFEFFKIFLISNAIP